jgi:hypothetical protein
MTIRQIQDTCEVLDRLDGAEAGEYLSSLSNTLGKAHYGKTDGSTEYPAILTLIWLQIEGMMEFILSDDPDSYGYEQEDIDLAMLRIWDIWNLT